MTDTDWSLDDIPIAKFNVITEPNPVTGEIKQITEIAGNIQREIIATKSDQVRNALIDMGWTPPEGKEHMPPTKLPDGFREEWLPKAKECRMFGELINDLPLFDLLAVCAYSFTRYFETQERVR